MEINNQENQENQKFQVFEYQGQDFEFTLLFWKHIFLSVISLGFYFPWAKQEIRSYMAKHTLIGKTPLQYEGKALEIFKAWLNIIITIVFFIIVLKIVSRFAGHLPFAKIILAITMLSLAIYGYSLAFYGGLKYKWEHMRLGDSYPFFLEKDAEQTQKFSRVIIRGFFLSLMSFGIYFPFLKNEITIFMTKRWHVDRLRFSYEMKEGFLLYMIYFKGCLLSLLTLGIALPWLRKELLSFRCKHTYAFHDSANSQIKFSFSGKELKSEIFIFCLWASPVTLLTLGLALPYCFSKWLKIKSKYFIYHATKEFIPKQSIQERNSSYDSGINNPLVPHLMRLISKK